ncbi:MAG: prolyl oligopeptidase family serine peptidase [Candidatus Wildermuthbacteria bacterium]|nr:prolyl oligopeptidase family serine peptidase [Candidatus Wildermuthbacteria bacterium]
MNTLRARFANDIISEFLPPSRPSKKVLILCSGMPSVPSKKTVMEFFAKKGYWVFFPRYRGSWESRGSFLKISPHQDILDIISQLPQGFASIGRDNTHYTIEAKSITLIASSFGGAAALLSATDPRVTKIIAFSPVVDWTAKSKKEPLDSLFEFVKEGFGEGYRVAKEDWEKLKSGNFYNPMEAAGNIPGNKILILHAKDDKVVQYKTVERFAKETKANAVFLKRGGHFSLSECIESRFQKRITKFLKAKL